MCVRLISQTRMCGGGRYVCECLKFRAFTKVVVIFFNRIFFAFALKTLYKHYKSLCIQCLFVGVVNGWVIAGRPEHCFAIAGCCCVKCMKTKVTFYFISVTTLRTRGSVQPFVCFRGSSLHFSQIARVSGTDFSVCFLQSLEERATTRPKE